MRDKLLVSLFEAYYSARKNKRNKYSTIEYEINYESNLIKLCDRLLDRSYKPKKSICFISFYPVQREIFASNFEDRIIHHLLFDYINDIFDNNFIENSYSCRINKGTSAGIDKTKKFMRIVSDNYTKNAYILKLDIQGYFMNINKHILWKQIFHILSCNKDKIQIEFDFLIWITRVVLFHDPTKNAIIKGNKSDWIGLPKDKSLFNKNKFKIGITS
jgi:retron-type reverse transcriptase